MSWQVCPACKGSKYNPHNMHYSNGYLTTICCICEGTGLLNEQTGKPPLNSVIINDNTTPTVFNDYIHSLPLTGRDTVSDKKKKQKKIRSRTSLHRKTRKRNSRT